MERLRPESLHLLLSVLGWASQVETAQQLMKRLQTVPGLQGVKDFGNLEFPPDTLDTLAYLFRSLDMGSSAKFCERMKEADLSLQELQRRILDDLDLLIFMRVPTGKEEFLGQLLFGPQVAEKFPSTANDIEEAAKCFAFGRSTACVFHLMRVLESGLRAIARKVNFPVDSGAGRPDWQPMLNKLEAELRKDYKEREFKGDHDFLAGVVAHFGNIKIAWRNRVMHVESKYDEEQALAIYNATKGFMQHLASQIGEA